MFPGRISHGALWEGGCENGKLMFDPFYAACHCLLHTSCLWFWLAGWCFTLGSRDSFWASALWAVRIAFCVCLRVWDEVLSDSKRDLLSSMDLFHGDIKIYWWSPGISFAAFHPAASNYFLRERVPVTLAYRWWCHLLSIYRTHSWDEWNKRKSWGL